MVKLCLKRSEIFFLPKFYQKRSKNFFSQNFGQKIILKNPNTNFGGNLGQKFRQNSGKTKYFGQNLAKKPFLRLFSLINFSLVDKWQQIIIISVFNDNCITTDAWRCQVERILGQVRIVNDFNWHGGKV